MRRIYLSLSLLAALAVPVAAHASSELLTITGNTETFTFLLPSSPVSAGDITSHTDYFTLTGITSTGPGLPASDTLDFYDGTFGGGLDDSLGGIAGPVSLSGTVLFGGTVSAPTFSAVSGGGLTDSNGNPYSYAITNVGGATPEPSSLVLLGTGALGLAGAFRRRLFGI